MSTEAKVFQKIRAVLIADATISSYVGSRVYLSHPVTVKDVIYPAISMHLIAVVAMVYAPDVLNMNIQLDVWADAKDYDVTDLLTMASRLRALLSRQFLTDTTIGITFDECVEASSGQIMYEDDTNLYHLPLTYGVIAHE